MKKVLISLILIISLLTSNVSLIVNADEKEVSEEVCLNEKVIELKYDMQRLWIEHAWWTRSFIVSDIAELKDTDKVLERLLQNQVEIGDIIKPYYGEKAGNKLTGLLKEHIFIAGKIIDAAKKGEDENVTKYTKEWFQNADKIVAFLTDLNPYWTKKELTDMFYTHLKLTSNEVVARLEKDWKNDIKNADANEIHLIMFGDMLTDGIVKQFPDKF